MEAIPVKRRLTPARILLIDDDIVFSKVLAHFLESRDYTVELAEDGYKGLAKFEASKPNLVLCDLNMPGLSGFQVVSRIRKLSADMPVIVISGADKIQDAVEAMKSGAWDYIEKPVENYEVLMDSLNKALRKAALEKENTLLRAQLENLVRIQDQELNSLNNELRAFSHAINFGFCATNGNLQILRHSTVLAHLLKAEDGLLTNRTLGEALRCRVQSTCQGCEHAECPFRQTLAENSPREAVWTIGEQEIRLKVLPVSDGAHCEGVFVLTEVKAEK